MLFPHQTSYINTYDQNESKYKPSFPPSRYATSGLRLHFTSKAYAGGAAGGAMPSSPPGRSVGSGPRRVPSSFTAPYSGEV